MQNMDLLPEPATIEAFKQMYTKCVDAVEHNFKMWTHHTRLRLGARI
jgi:hypothetical protein